MALQWATGSIIDIYYDTFWIAGQIDSRINRDEPQFFFDFLLNLRKAFIRKDPYLFLVFGFFYERLQFSRNTGDFFEKGKFALIKFFVGSREGTNNFFNDPFQSWLEFIRLNMLGWTRHQTALTSKDLSPCSPLYMLEFMFQMI
jgi:hypothetical protein